MKEDGSEYSIKMMSVIGDFIGYGDINQASMELVLWPVFEIGGYTESGAVVTK